MDDLLKSMLAHKVHRDNILPRFSSKNQAWLTSQYPEKNEFFPSIKEDAVWNLPTTVGYL